MSRKTQRGFIDNLFLDLVISRDYIKNPLVQKADNMSLKFQNAAAERFGKHAWLEIEDFYNEVVYEKEREGFRLGFFAAMDLWWEYAAERGEEETP